MEGVTGSYRELKEVTRVCSSLQRVTRGYKGVTGGYKELPGYNRVQKVTRG